MIWSRTDLVWSLVSGLAMFAMILAGLPFWSGLVVGYAALGIRVWLVVIRPAMRGEPVQSPPRRHKRAPSA